jgi:hypothetical protein
MLKWEILPASHFDRLAGAWDALAASGGYPAFMESPFMRPALAQLLQGKHRLAAGYDAGQLAAAGILVKVGMGRWSTFQPSQLPLGAWLMAPGVDLESALGSLCRALPGPVARITLTQQDPQTHPRLQDSRTLQTLDYISTAWVDVRGSFEEFWEARGKNLRQNLRKQRRKIEGEAHALTVDVATEPERVAALFSDYATLESSGWKSQQGTAVSAASAQGRFYASTLQNFAACGRAICLALRLDGAPIAVDLCVRSADSIVILKTTYDEARKALSPGQLLHEEAFRHFFALPGLRRVEFFGRVMEWHTRWTESSRTLFHVNFYRWGALQSLHSRVRARRLSAAQAGAPSAEAS